MLSNLIVKNYRNLSDLKIDSLSRVNLITGKNNTGKTALLEAISIYEFSRFQFSDTAARSQQHQYITYESTVFEWILYLLQKRGNEIIRDDGKDKGTPDYQTNLLSIESLFNDSVTGIDKSHELEIGTIPYALKLKLIKPTVGLFPPNHKLEIIDFNSQNNSDHIHAQILITPYLAGIYGNPENLNIRFIDTFHLYNERNSIDWDQIQFTDSKKEDVMSALGIIDNRISDLAFIQKKETKNSRKPIVKLKDGNTESLWRMGDGINRILNIILALVNAGKGCLLIDEFENGLHHSVQEKLWEIIFKTAKELDVQVFATTHSEDCVKAFAKIQNQNPGEGQYIRLQNKKGKIVSVAYSEEDILTATEHNIEPR